MTGQLSSESNVARRNSRKTLPRPLVGLCAIGSRLLQPRAHRLAGEVKAGEMGDQWKAAEEALIPSAHRSSFASAFDALGPRVRR
ncbi:hypothetical protein EGR_04227 [Echinococcus granulosus]|uniref:Uncharacterized protein n=1 Tax=Echinococcus granulosus TaxID=6210 RepID=W6UIN9_ECHGR|nr:hypothetical protein EGR_04227 [Echinococcus granulosus]EUB60981.1 hypothetical protein EGR_04227 [Echinococcus granulosus]